MGGIVAAALSTAPALAAGEPLPAPHRGGDGGVPRRGTGGADEVAFCFTPCVAAEAGKIAQQEGQRLACHAFLRA